MAHRKIQKNYEFFSNFDYFVPGPIELLIVFALFLAGALLGNLVSLPLIALLRSNPDGTMYATLVSYVMIFIPPMIYASIKSKENSFFGKGYKLSNNHYSPLGKVFCIVLVTVVAICNSFLAQAIISLLPPVPEWLEDMLKNLTSGNFLLNFLCISIFAPLFEEWLCRGIVLRGLLNYEHKNKDGETVRGMKPVWAIVISAAFFAVIHFNPWQAIAAFMMGLLMGYVYYRTGSIWPTILMHFVNNTFALILGNIDSLKDVENFKDVMPGGLFWAVMAFCVVFIVYFVSKFLAIKPLDRQGSCAELVSE